MKKYKLPKVILGVCLIGLIGYKDTGMFVKDFAAIDENGEQSNFNKYESITLISDKDENYLIEKEGIKYSVPGDSLIRTSKTSQTYKLLKDTIIEDAPLEIGFKSYKKGELFQLLKHEDDYGLFEAKDGTIGYIKLDKLEAIEEDYYTYGTSKVNKIIKDGDLYYTLVKGQPIVVKDFKDNNYILVDEKGNEFKVASNEIQLNKRIKQTVSRSGDSKVSRDISRVVQSAYEKLGSKYVYADTGKSGFDCSGLTYAIYSNELGIKLNRSSIDQARDGIEVAREELIPGDLVFFKTSSRTIGHVGIYIGEGDMIHSSSSQNRVIITNIDNSPYYTSRYVTGRRIIK